MQRTFKARRSGAPLPAEEFASLPDALYWAEHCAWVPGSGHCSNRDCGEACVFLLQRLSELERLVVRRRARRVEHRRTDGRPCRAIRRYLIVFTGIGGGLLGQLLGLHPVIPL